MERWSARTPCASGPEQTIEALTGFLEAAGCGFTTTTAPGDVTVGGVLAINGHGAAVPAAGGVADTWAHLRLAEQPDPRPHGCRLRQPDGRLRPAHDRAGRPRMRGLPDTPRPHLRHRGRAADGRERRRAMPELHRRPAAELFAPPGPAGSAGRTFSSYLDAAGRVGDLVRVHGEPLAEGVDARRSSRRGRVPSARPTTTVLDNIPKEIAQLADRIVTGQTQYTRSSGSGVRLLGRRPGRVTGAPTSGSVEGRLALHPPDDPARHRQRLRRPVAPRRRAARRQRLHHVLPLARRRPPGARRVPDERSGGDPLHRLGPRVRRGRRGGGGAGDLGADAQRRSPDWDTATWFDVLTFPDTAGSNAFFRELEQFIVQPFRGRGATGVVEGLGLHDGIGVVGSHDALERDPEPLPGVGTARAPRSTGATPHACSPTRFLIACSPEQPVRRARRRRRRRAGHRVLTMHVRGEAVPAGDAVAPLVLGAVERLVGLGEDLLVVELARLGRADAEGHRDHQARDGLAADGRAHVSASARPARRRRRGRGSRTPRRRCGRRGRRRAAACACGRPRRAGRRRRRRGRGRR